MRIPSAAPQRPDASRDAGGASDPPARPAKAVPPQRTALAPSEIRAALARAHQQLHGKAIDPERLGVLTAQVCHETGFGASMYNFNFGGIKGTSPEGLTARCRTKEVLGGEVKSIVDGFRAYSSADRGAADYLSFVERRYDRAWQAAGDGDVNGFVHALKAKGYFTADESGYAAAVRNVLARAGDPRPQAATTAVTSAAEASAPGATIALFPEGPTSVALCRVMDAIAHASARIAGPATEET